MSIKIGHASIDENGSARGGTAGDQTGKELCTRSWYTKGWNVLLRPKRAELAEKSAAACEAACANSNIGYDQGGRNTLYYTMAPALTVKYDKMIDAGIDPEIALEVNEEIKELREIDAPTAEYWRVCINASSNEATQMSLLYSWMDEKTYAKAKMAYDLDVSPSMFVEYFVRRSQYDKDDNGYYSIAESKTAIDAIGEGYTDEQKGVLWQMCTGSKSTKNNPYSKSAGQKYLDAKNAQKAE